MARNLQLRHGYLRQRYLDRMALLEAFKSKPCIDCGNRFSSECMDFDHRPDQDKCAPVSDFKTMNLDRLLTEINKCDLVCANCHRIRTKKRIGEQAIMRRESQGRLYE